MAGPDEFQAIVARQAAIEIPPKPPMWMPPFGCQTPGYPPGHQVGTHVPPQGSSCATCRFLVDAPEGATCVEPNFVAWDAGIEKPAGSGKIPGGDAQLYCSDLWQVRLDIELSKP